MAERFIHEFEIALTPAQARVLRIRLDLARQLYNAFLGEALALPRRGGCGQLVGRLWDRKQARALPRGESGSTQGW